MHLVNTSIANSNPKNLVQSLAKGFAVLRAFGDDLTPASVPELAARTGLDRGTTFRLVHTLLGLGYLHQVPGARRFTLSLQCLELGYRALSRNGLADHAAPLLRSLVPVLGDAASLGELDGDDVVYVERAQSGLEDRQNLDRGKGARVHAYRAAIGHAILAYLPRERQIEALEAYRRAKQSRHMPTDPDALLQRLDQVRQQGYAVSDGENCYGLRILAAPVLDREGNPVAAVSLTARVERMPLQDFTAGGLPAVRHLAETLSTAVQHSFGRIAQPRSR